MSTDKMAAARAAKGKTIAKTTEKLLQEATSALPATAVLEIREKLLEMPEVRRKGYLRAISGKSRLAAIKAFCLECMGWLRGEVTLCTSPACPLFSYRPFQV